MEIDLKESLFKRCESLLSYRWLELTFPNSDAVPSKCRELVNCTGVPGFVASDFVLPEGNIALGHAECLASVMTMPETSIDENACCIFSHDEVRMAWQTGIVEPIPESMGKKIASYNQLWLGVLGANRRHISMTLRGS